MSLCGTDEQLKIELLSQWKLEAEFRNKIVGNAKYRKVNLWRAFVLSMIWEGLSYSSI